MQAKSSPSDFSQVGRIAFEFVGEDTVLQVNIFVARWGAYQGQEPVESEEMRPAWFELSEEYLRAHRIRGKLANGESADLAAVNERCGLPFASMWLDDPLWFPRALKGDKFDGTSLFEGHDKLLTLDLENADKF